MMMRLRRLLALLDDGFSRLTLRPFSGGHASTDDKEILKSRGQRGLRRHHRERAERGWSAYDAWSADGHILRIIGEVALYYRDSKAGYPAGISQEEWDGILTRIGEPLIDYANRQFDAAHDDPVFENAYQALLLFAEWHGHFWN